jgi:hypothetical protein
MAVQWDRSNPPSSIVADRNLYLDASNNKVVEEGDAASASQLVAAGHVINQADADRLGLIFRDGKVVQDRAVKIEEHQKLVDDLDKELDALYESIAQYKKENSTKDIPNTMEKARVDLETRHEHAKLALGQFKKFQEGKDPLRGESQATSVEPEKSQTARDATKKANAAVAASPSPRELAASAPTRKAEVAPQHPATAVSPLAVPAAAAPAARKAATARPTKGAATKTAAAKSASKSASRKGRGGK